MNALQTVPVRRVLHVAHHALPHVGGLERVVGAETSVLAGRGWEVAVVSSATATVAGEEVVGRVRGLRVAAWNGLEERYGVPFPLYSPRLLPVLVHEVRRADVVHVHDVLYLTSWVAALCCRLLGRPYVVHRHVGFVHHSSALVRAVQRAVLATLGRWVLAGAAAVVAIDEPIARGLRATVREPARVRVVGNGVDADRFCPVSTPAERDRLRGELGLPVDEPLVLFVGRAVPKKGFPLVAAARSERYLLVFAGSDRPAGVTDPRLHFLGSVPPERMPEVYRAADLVVVASVGECPLTVLEAMASGVPVVLLEDPALHSPWTAGAGVWFVDRCSEMLAEVLEKLVADRTATQREGAAGREAVRKAFTWQVHASALEALYDDVLA